MLVSKPSALVFFVVFLSASQSGDTGMPTVELCFEFSRILFGLGFLTGKDCRADAKDGSSLLDGNFIV